VNVWVGITIAVVLLLVGMMGVLFGLVVVVQQLRKRQVNKTHRAKKIAEIRQLPHRATQILTASTRPTVPGMQVQRVDLRPQNPEQNPTLSPADEEPDVPTAVFRPSQYKDIEALLKDADKYVDKHKR
jgi:hypothetical protein